MIQSAVDTYCFHLGHSPYVRICIRAWLLFCSFLSIAVLALALSHILWISYSHTFTLYLKWQDALVALMCFVAFLLVSGSILILRFLYALHKGYHKGMLTLVGNSSLAVRDLSPENLASIFWMIHSVFWCFVAALVGLLPEVLIGWTLHLSNPALMVLATGVALVLSLAGLVVSVVSIVFIVIGCIGAISFCRKLGSLYTYKLSNQAILRIDNFVLTIIYPGAPESMIDLNLLDRDDQRQLLSLLRKRWMDTQYIWNPELGEEIEVALEEAERSIIFV